MSEFPRANAWTVRVSWTGLERLREMQVKAGGERAAAFVVAGMRGDGGRGNRCDASGR